MDLLTLMQIQRSFRLSLVCLKGVTAVLASTVIQILSDRGLIWSICLFIQSHPQKYDTRLPRWTLVVRDLVRLQEHGRNRCSIQRLNPREAMYWPLESY